VKTFEIRIQGFAGVDEALAMQEPVARVLCPVPEHDGPCEVPWRFTVDAGELLLGIYATPEKSTEVADEIRRVVAGRQITLTDAAPGDFEDLAEQYAIEHPVR
jgi:hypothetical protein